MKIPDSQKQSFPMAFHAWKSSIYTELHCAVNVENAGEQSVSTPQYIHYIPFFYIVNKQNLGFDEKQGLFFVKIGYVME